MVAPLAAAGLITAWLWFTTDLPDEFALDRSAMIVDRNGETIAVLSRGGTRLEVPLEDVGPHVVDALIATEDRSFYEHRGLAGRGILRAVWNNFTDDDVEGGSTITQQLVKNAYLSSERTLARKAREAVLAVKAERRYSKDEILEQYLNTVYFGRGAFGIEAAARAWFGTSASDLNLPQSALLVGLLHAPERYDSNADPETLAQRRNAVLDAMVEDGRLASDRAAAARGEPLGVLDETPGATKLTAGVAGHFVEAVRAEVTGLLGADALYTDGLVIRTTLDLADQRAAENAVSEAMTDVAPEVGAAVVGVDRSGAVRAWVGGRDFDRQQVDLVSGAGGSGRQPGSTFKPFTLAAYMEMGRGAGNKYVAPSHLELDLGDELWEVDNADGRDHGTLTVLDATVKSVNTVYAQIVQEVGADRVAELAARVGAGEQFAAHPSIALGAQEVTPLSLASAYATLSRDGVRIEPFTIESVETRAGDVLYEHVDESTPVLDGSVAASVSAVLEQVASRGTATRARLDRPMAAKTGTSQRGADAWLAGYTPEYTAVVWLGRVDGNQPLPAIGGRTVYGGTVPAVIWHDFMSVALEDVEPTDFPTPDADLLDADDDRRPMLTVAPALVQPGDIAAVEVSGTHLCLGGWTVEAVLADAAPGVIYLGRGSIDPQQQTTALSTEVQEPSRLPTAVALELPDDAARGTWKATLRCVDGREVATGSFDVGVSGTIDASQSPATADGEGLELSDGEDATPEKPRSKRERTTTTTTAPTTTAPTTTTTAPTTTTTAPSTATTAPTTTTTASTTATTAPSTATTAPSMATDGDNTG